MSSMIRRLMRNVTRRFGSKRSALSGGPAVGSQRAGMHQAAEHEYQRSRMAEGEPVPETPEDALDMPGAIEAEIPPVEEEDDEIVEEIATGEETIAAEEEILEEIADPAASEEEETAADAQLSCKPGKRTVMAVDYSAERIPVLDPVLGGIGVPAETPLEYSSGDGSLKEIQEPLPGLGEKMGIPPVVDGIPDPSANVAAYEEPEPEPEPEPDPEPEPEPDPEPVEPVE